MGNPMSSYVANTLIEAGKIYLERELFEKAKAAFVISKFILENNQLEHASLEEYLNKCNKGLERPFCE